MHLEILGRRCNLRLPLAGAFQAHNALCALGLAIAEGADPEKATEILGRLEGVAGRLELVGRTAQGAAAYVDYAHTPDALETVLSALRPHTRGRLFVVFGAGGDRDRGKRPQMGEVARRLADRAIVTDDNPRSEDPAEIRKQILAAVPEAENIGDRRAAILQAVAELRGGRHPGGCRQGPRARSDHRRRDPAVRRPRGDPRCPGRPGGEPVVTAAPLWTAAEAADATGGQAIGDWMASGVSIDSRSLEPGDLFVALQGPNFDGHDYVQQALDAGACAALVHSRPEGLGEDAPLLLVEDSLAGLWALGRAARARSKAQIVAVTGSVGKTGTKTALHKCLSALGETSASAASFNNHWGVPLSLARMSRSAVYGVFELGMNNPGEIGPLSRLVRPEVSIITTVEPVHLAQFRSVAEIADAKAEIFEGMNAGGAAVLNRDNPFFPVLLEKAQACGVGRALSFGRHPEANIRLLDCSLHATCSSVRALVKDRELEYCLSLPGEHWVINSLAVIGAIFALGADVGTAAAELARLDQLKGRGQRHSVDCAGGSFLLIDESYNANPASMRAALDVLARTETRGEGRRIAILGDMLELGASSAQRHARLAEAVEAGDIDLVYSCGSDMAALHEALPKARRGAHAPDSDALATIVTAAVGPGDAVMVKGSLGSRMAVIVTALMQPNDPPLRAANGD